VVQIQYFQLLHQREVAEVVRTLRRVMVVMVGLVAVGQIMHRQVWLGEVETRRLFLHHKVTMAVAGQTL
jgi:hypothetical protein